MPSAAMASSSSSGVHKSRLVEIHPERVGAINSPSLPYHSPDGDGAFDLESFRSNLRLSVTHLSTLRISFDLVGVDASIANALRRVLMAEVPTVAVEDVFIWNNTSIVQDEVLAHRLGLVPLLINPDKIEFKLPDDQPNDQNTVVFRLKAKCERVPGTKKDDLEHVRMTHSSVYSKDLQWDPKGDQEEDLGPPMPRAVHDDILLVKMRPGQELSMELHCVKGIGKDHAKFSPVSTASYRLLPHIEITAPIPQADIAKLVKCFPEGVMGVRRNKETGEEEPYVKDPRRDTVSREVLRHKEFEGKIKLGRVRDHFLFDIESTGIIAPQDLVPAAIKVMVDKIRRVRKGVEALEQLHGLA